MQPETARAEGHVAPGLHTTGTRHGSNGQSRAGSLAQINFIITKMMPACIPRKLRGQAQPLPSPRPGSPPATCPCPGWLRRAPAPSCPTAPRDQTPLARRQPTLGPGHLPRCVTQLVILSHCLFFPPPRKPTSILPGWHRPSQHLASTPLIPQASCFSNRLK